MLLLLLLLDGGTLRCAFMAWPSPSFLCCFFLRLFLLIFRTSLPFLLILLFLLSFLIFHHVSLCK